MGSSRWTRPRTGPPLEAKFRPNKPFSHCRSQGRRRPGSASFGARLGSRGRWGCAARPRSHRSFSALYSHRLPPATNVAILLHSVCPRTPVVFSKGETRHCCVVFFRARTSLMHYTALIFPPLSEFPPALAAVSRPGAPSCYAALVTAGVVGCHLPVGRWSLLRGRTPLRPLVTSISRQ